MKRFLFIFALFTCHFCFGQFADSVSKIRFNYSKGHSSWNAPGIYSRSETIEISKLMDGRYAITGFFRVNFSAGPDGKTYSKDTTTFPTAKYDGIAPEKIQNYLTQLNTSKDLYVYSFIRPKLSEPTRSEILSVAKKYDLLWMLKGPDAEKEDTRQVMSEIKAFEKLDSFLEISKSGMEYDLMVTDNWNRLNIEVISGGDTTMYLSQFFVPLGQPILRFERNNFRNTGRIINLEANIAAQWLLPPNSRIFKILDMNNLKEEYIKWYLKNIF